MLAKATIVLGTVEDRSRHVRGVREPLDVEERLANLISDGTAACREAGLAAPVFEEIATRFRLTIRTARIGRPTRDATDEAILARLAGAKGLLTSEIAKTIGLTRRATRTWLARLAGRGLVREVGAGPQDPKRRYFRAE